MDEYTISRALRSAREAGGSRHQIIRLALEKLGREDVLEEAALRRAIECRADDMDVIESVCQASETRAKSQLARILANRAAARGQIVKHAPGRRLECMGRGRP